MLIPAVLSNMADDSSTHSLDRDLAELREISAGLKQCADATERANFLVRQSELRARWAPKLSDLPTEKLLERKRKLRVLLKEATRGKFDTAAAGGSARGGGFDPVQTHKHNRKIDKQNGRSELETELSEVLDILALRGENV